MRSVLALLSLAVAAFAVPVESDVSSMKRNIIKRQSVTTGADDATVLQFALTLEHLENSFYSEALTKFNATSFDAAGFNGLYPVLQQVGKDEAAHVEFLTTALTAAGATPVQACNYTFPYTDVASFLALSQVIEGVGVSAYLGAAGSINNTAYLTAAASILTVEARHAAAIQFIHGYQPASQLNDTPLSASNVVTLVTPFFKSCPTGSAPTIMGNPALNVTTAMPMVNSTLAVSPANATVVENVGTVYCGFASGLGASFSTWKNGSCMIPSQNITLGQAYVVLTTGPSLADASIIAGPAVLELGTANLTGIFLGNATHAANATSSNSTGKAVATGSAKAATGAAGSVKMGAAGVVGALVGAVALLV